MTINKRDFLKTVPAVVPATMLGGMAGGLVLPALAQSPRSFVRTARIAQETRPEDFLDVVRIHLNDPVSHSNSAFDFVDSAFESYGRARDAIANELCSELTELISTNLDINIEHEACVKVVNYILGEAGDIIIALTLGRVRWLLMGARYVLLITKSR